MKSFQTLYTDIATITVDSTTASATWGKQLLNDTQRIVLGYANWPFLEFTDTKTTVSGTNNYQMPNKMKKLMSVIVTVGTTVYRPRPIEDPKFWEYLQSLNSGKSDATQYFYKQGNKVYLYPTPSTTGSTITFRGRKGWKDLSLADYATGTIKTVVVGDETIVGDSTVWTGRKPIDGQWMRIAAGASSGDYEWYEIASVTDNTNLELTKGYEGTAITAGSVGYTIGEFSVIPSAYHDLLLWRSLAIYFQKYSLDEGTRADRFWMLYDGGFERGVSRTVGGLLKVMEDDQLEKTEGAFIDPSEKSVDDLKRFRIDTITGESW